MGPDDNLGIKRLKKALMEELKAVPQPYHATRDLRKCSSPFNSDQYEQLFSTSISVQKIV